MTWLDLGISYSNYYFQATTGRPGARFGPGGIRLGSRRIHPGGYSIYTGKSETSFLIQLSSHFQYSVGTRYAQVGATECFRGLTPSVGSSGEVRRYFHLSLCRKRISRVSSPPLHVASRSCLTTKLKGAGLVNHFHAIAISS
jgi:hypothetical protein